MTVDEIFGHSVLYLSVAKGERVESLANIGPGCT
jgi:hypothetical protein